MNHSSNTLRFSFAPTGSNDKRVQDGFHYVELDSDEDSMQLNVKCKEIYISSTAGTVEYRVIAELTNIDTNSMGPISGSGISD